MRIELIKPETHDLEKIALEMQKDKWDYLGHNYNAEAIANFVSSNERYFLLAFLENEVAGMLVAYMLPKMDKDRDKEVFWMNWKPSPGFNDVE